MEREFGERVRHIRMEQRLSLDELAARSGVSRATLSKIERGERETRLGNALRIAEALQTPLAQLLPEPAGESVRVVRNGTAPQLVDPETKVVREALIEPQPGLELIRYELPGHAAPEGFPAHEPGTHETFVVLEGAVVVTSGDHEVELAAGDAAVLSGDRDHRMRNPGPSRTRLLLLISRPLRKPH
ncbi:MAG: helix-turn-helix domain-containing protein [Pseudonocardiaceae bacterium]